MKKEMKHTGYGLHSDCAAATSDWDVRNVGSCKKLQADKIYMVSVSSICEANGKD